MLNILGTGGSSAVREGVPRRRPGIAAGAPKNATKLFPGHDKPLIVLWGAGVDQRIAVAQGQVN
jgi:hypothetical protein